MLKIVNDDCGRHDFLVTPRSQQMFVMMSGTSDYHPSCLENIEKTFAGMAIRPENIGATFNIFMNITLTEVGQIRVESPRSRAGDAVIFLALMNLHVALTACSDEGSNGGSCKPVHFEIIEK